MPFVRGVVSPEAGPSHLDDDGVVNEAIDGSSSGHGVAEDAVPLREDEVANDGDALALVALSEEGKEHFHLVALLLDVAKVVDKARQRRSSALIVASRLCRRAAARGECRDDGSNTLVGARP